MADPLAALLHSDPDVCGNPSGIMVHSGEGYCDRIAARLRAAGVTVGLDVERLAAALEAHRDTFDGSDWHRCYPECAAAIARAYAATPQPAEEEG